MDLKLLHKYKSEGLLFNQKHPSLPLTIWNYSDKVQYEGLRNKTNTYNRYYSECIIEKTIQIIYGNY